MEVGQIETKVGLRNRIDSERDFLCYPGRSSVELLLAR